MRRSFLKAAAIVVIGGVAASANAQFLNPGFETGDFSDWTIQYTPNGTGGVELVEMYDIDGPGPLPTSYAARFDVGQVVFTSGVHEGVELVQDLNLTGGTTYTISFNWSSYNTSASANANGGKYHIIVNGSVIAEHDTGFISSGEQRYGFLTADYTPASSGVFEVGTRITRPYIRPGTLFQYVDNFEPGGAAGLTLTQTGGTCGSSSVTLTVSNASDGNRIALAYGFRDGSTSVPMCPGLSVDIDGAKAAGVRRASGGTASFSGSVPSAACARILTQAVDIDDCLKSNKLTGLN